MSESSDDIILDLRDIVNSRSRFPHDLILCFKLGVGWTSSRRVGGDCAATIGVVAGVVGLGIPVLVNFHVQLKGRSSEALRPPSGQYLPVRSI